MVYLLRLGLLVRYSDYINLKKEDKMMSDYQQHKGQYKQRTAWLCQFKKRNLYCVSIMIIWISSLFLISCSSGNNGSRRTTFKPNAAHRSVFLRNDHSHSCNTWKMINAGMKKRCIRR